MNRRQLLGLSATGALVPFALDELPKGESDLLLAFPTKTHGLVVAEIIPAPDYSRIQGPAVLDADGKRVGQLVFRTARRGS